MHLVVSLFFLNICSTVYGEWCWAVPPNGFSQAVKPSLDTVIKTMNSRQQKNYKAFYEVAFYGESGDKRGLVLKTQGNQRYYKKGLAALGLVREKRIRYFGVLYTLGAALPDEPATVTQDQKIQERHGVVGYTMKVVSSITQRYENRGTRQVKEFRFTKRTSYAVGAAYRVEHQIQAAVKMILKKSLYGLGFAYLTGLGALILLPTGVASAVKELGIGRTADEVAVQMPRCGPNTI